MGRESQLSKSVADLLQLMMNAGKVIWHDRLNSGRIPVRKGRHFQWIHLCKKGTPDRFAILNDGRVLWLEIKRMTERLDDKQADFKKMIDQIPNHTHLTIRCIEDLEEFFNFPGSVIWRE